MFTRQAARGQRRLRNSVLKFPNVVSYALFILILRFHLHLTEHVSGSV